MIEVGNITIGTLLEQQAKQYGDHEALVYTEPALRYTYREFNQICRQVAKGFMKLGINKDSNLAIWANNIPEWVITQFATGKMGAVLVTVNTSYRLAELEYILKQSDAETLLLIEGVRGSEYRDIIYELCPELRDCEPGKLQSQRLPKLKRVIYLGAEKMPGMLHWQDVLAAGKEVSEAELDSRMDSLAPDEVINMQYTSGTTGFPKGVMLTHTNLIGNSLSIQECLRFTPEDRLCIPVPFFHCFGCVLGTLTCVVSGATMVPVLAFLPKKVMETVQAEKCTALHGVPTMFIAELEEMKRHSYDTSSLRTGIMAGSPCPIEIMKDVINIMGAKEICITYGQTETSPGITMTRTDDPLEIRVSTVGKVLPNVEAKIVDPKTGVTLAPGQQGELCSRGYHIMKGYYKMPEATAATIDSDGWLHTGDLAVVDENGYYKITGRLKDMIIRGGENIYPREIEEFLYTHPKIKDVQVIGVPSSKYGEEVAAYIELKDNETSTQEEIQGFCREKIAHYKVPKYVLFTHEYPTTASGKVQKYKLRQMAIQALGLK